MAKWKEGNKRYFVALVNSQHSQWAEELDRYQCFLYEDISNTMRMAQGQFSASCQGLWSVLEGSRTFSLQKREFAPRLTSIINLRVPLSGLGWTLELQTNLRDDYVKFYNHHILIS